MLSHLKIIWQMTWIFPNAQNTVGPADNCFNHIIVSNNLLYQLKYCVHTCFWYILADMLRLYLAVLSIAFYYIMGVRVMVFNATFNDNSVIPWRSVLLVEETRVPGENNWPVISHWQALSHYVVLRTPHLGRIQTHNISGTPSNQFNLSIIPIDTKNDNETNDFKS